MAAKGDAMKATDNHELESMLATAESQGKCVIAKAKIWRPIQEGSSWLDAMICDKCGASGCATFSVLGAYCYACSPYINRQPLNCQDCGNRLNGGNQVNGRCCPCYKQWAKQECERNRRLAMKGE